MARAGRERGREPLRGAACNISRLTPLVGREDELDLVLRRWRQAVRGEGKVVLLCVSRVSASHG
jgi:hypothetical protein